MAPGKGKTFSPFSATVWKKEKKTLAASLVEKWPLECRLYTMKVLYKFI
jgi:hypothetical protein